MSALIHNMLAAALLSKRQRISIKPACIFSQSSSDASLLRTTSHALQPSLPLVHPTSTIFLPISSRSPHLLWPSPHHQLDPRGEDISNPKPKMSIQAHNILSIHVFLQGPSTKEIIICQ
ncbi:hypothetical protein GOODEAATRI_012196 [Goodea atripinnis]|uniref:Uncharacterized protein n=1 Tax=Goodea atripinnis TaxID=208336 RepID=A0ABV0MI85_9TELE